MDEILRQVQVRLSCRTAAGNGCGWSGVVTADQRRSGWTTAKCPKCGQEISRQIPLPRRRAD